MKTFMTMLFALYAASCIAAPVKSIIGGKNIEKAAKANNWTNPYIVDGLVAMWDGEWNMKGGEHASMPSMWVDLCTKTPMSFSVGPKANSETAKIEFLENKVSINGMIGSVFHIEIQQALNSMDYTIEYVICPASGKEGTRYYLIDDSWRNGNGLFYWGLCGVRSQTPWAKVPEVEDVNYVCVSDKNGQRKQRLANKKVGIFDYNSSVADISNHYQTSRFVLFGNEQFNYDFAFYGMIYCIRIYNRALSNEEVAYNYEIDKMRFGL